MHRETERPGDRDRQTDRQADRPTKTETGRLQLSKKS